MSTDSERLSAQLAECDEMMRCVIERRNEEKQLEKEVKFVQKIQEDERRRISLIMRSYEYGYHRRQPFEETPDTQSDHNKTVEDLRHELAVKICEEKKLKLRERKARAYQKRKAEAPQPAKQPRVLLSEEQRAEHVKEAKKRYYLKKMGESLGGKSILERLSDKKTERAILDAEIEKLEQMMIYNSLDIEIFTKSLDE